MFVNLLQSIHLCFLICRIAISANSVCFFSSVLSRAKRGLPGSRVLGLPASQLAISCCTFKRHADELAGCCCCCSCRTRTIARGGGKGAGGVAAWLTGSYLAALLMKLLTAI